jgi:hypothetical protein
VDRLLEIFLQINAPSRQAVFDEHRDFTSNWRLVDPQQLTSYSSFDLHRPWQLQIAATAPPALLKRRSLHFLDATWHFHKDRLDVYKALFDRASKASPLAKFVMIARTPFCAYRLGQAGIAAVYGHSSAFEDDHLWSIEEPPVGGAPRYEALYNARLVGWKNHQLASLLKNQIFVYGYESKEGRPVEEVRKAFPNACLANHDLNNGTYTHFDAHEISKLHADCHVSLALSFEEGFMRASAQSLLAGRPIVTVANIGGRNRFYHEDTALFVDPTPEAVKAGVDQLKARNLSPEFVRRETLKLLQIERRDVMESINAIRARVFGPTVRTLDFEVFRGIKFRQYPVGDFWQALEEAVG